MFSPASLHCCLWGRLRHSSCPGRIGPAATLLVQSQDLPSSLVEAPTTGAIEQRIARICEQVLSRGDLIQLIEQNDLYSDERRSKPLSKVIEEMRHATSVSALSSDIGQQSGSQNNTIAIAMSYDYPDPSKAQAVLQSFVSKFLSMDSADVEDQANANRSVPAGSGEQAPGADFRP